MKKILIILIAIGFILSCKFLDKVEEQKADIRITLDYSQLNNSSKISKVRSTEINAVSIDVVSIVIFKIDYSYSSISNYQVDTNIQTDADNWTGYWIPYVKEQLNDISNDKCTQEESSDLSISGNSATGEFTLEPGVYNILVGLFENSNLKYVGASDIIDLRAGDSESITIYPIEISETISSPNTPSGSASGTTDISYTYTTGGSISNLGHSVEYRFDWGDGSYSGWTTNGSSSHSWSSDNTYYVKAQARCASHTDKVSSWSNSKTVTIAQLTETINTPNTPSGSVACTTGMSYTYTTGGSTSNLGHNIEYLFDWDSGAGYYTPSGWSANNSATRVWDNEGTVEVRVQARSATNTDIVSNWSNGLTVTITSPVEIVTFPDPNFEALIRETLNKSSGDITIDDLESIQSIKGSQRNISDIMGIEYCKNLRSLELNSNSIQDITGLSNLVHLDSLELSENNINDISSISNLINLEFIHLGFNNISNINSIGNLTNLSQLYLFNNQISDISSIANLTNLEVCWIRNNQISDIDPISNLNNIWHLDISGNNISDISVVTNLINIQSLWLENNQISDIYSLVQNAGIGYGDHLTLWSNPLNNPSIYEYIPQLQDRGVDLGYDEPETVTDIDGNVYKTVQIGNQVWMAENLKVIHYRNGEAIPNVTDDYEWSVIFSGAYRNYDNNESYVSTYGRLYNWFAANDYRNLAPNGWHIPTDIEWQELEMYLGMSQTDANSQGDGRGTNEGYKLKSTYGWQENGNGNNESGFTALPGGSAPLGGSYSPIYSIARFWTSTANSNNFAWSRKLDWWMEDIYRLINNRQEGFSIRCIKD